MEKMSISFKINGKSYKKNYPVDITLNTFIRQHANLPATKFMCLEGGCGVCICVIKGPHPVTKEMKTWATNSCLTLLNVCDGWEIITAEGLGNKKDGYHPIQTRLAQLNGTQCGYCSPAMVMNMYGLLESKNGKVSMEDVENSFGGNICRCTGYRPILDAMKSFASDADVQLLDQCKDIEDLNKDCPKTGQKCSGTCRIVALQTVLEDGRLWIQANTVNDIVEGFNKIGNKPYMLVAGNTAHGVYRRPVDIQAFIDVNKVADLHKHSFTDTGIELGANLSLTELLDILRAAAKQRGFEYCESVVNHFDLIANVPVRNMGTLAGNLSIKHEHKEFPSDIFINLEALDAKLSILGNDLKVDEVSVLEYLKMDMNKRIILKITLPMRSQTDYRYNSYKIMPRAQNAHAYVNAAFLLQIDGEEIKSARLCFGGIKPDFTHATNTEKFLVGKKLFNNETIHGAMNALMKELDPDWILPDASPEYRKTLACGLFYKFFLKIAPQGYVKQDYKLGGEILHRPLSTGTQIYDTRKDMYPITKPIAKIEALAQCSGEAFYMNDLAPIPGELWAAFVHATQVNSKIVKIDPSEALNMPGVVAFFSAKDIPGENNFVDSTMLGYREIELIFCKDVVQHHSQPLGVIVAEAANLAKLASEKVKVLYEKASSVVMPTLADVFENNATHKIQDILTVENLQENGCNFQKIKDLFLNRTENKKQQIALENSKKIAGSFDVGSQYHYTMEPQTCVCIPTEDGIDVYSASQWMDLTQSVIANCLKIKKSKIFVQVRRVGGGYGGKISRNAQIACACALASIKLNKPVRFVQSLESMMSSLGKRFACHSDYEVNVDEKGKVLNLQNTFYEDCGITINENPIRYLTTITAQNCYSSDQNWKLSGKAVKTDAPSHTWCRAPGALEGIAMIENIMEHISRETQQDPADVRMRNIKDGNKMQKLLPEFLKSTAYQKRKEEITAFNKTNRWRKRGLGIALMQYPTHYFGMNPATVSVYQGDGSVSISHGGIEMGQGINTKIAQVAAFVLGVPLESIRIHPSDSFNGANAVVSGGGVASETVCFAVKKACEELLLRMKPVRDSLKDPSWMDVVKKSYSLNIPLTATHTHKAGDLQGYDVYGLALSEVEVDILTGNLLITRVDILEDTGESLSPLIDIGQIEGAFVMGIGYWLTEKLVYDRQTGELLTNCTWTYKPPGVKDIPIDFRITLLQNSPNPAGFLRSKATGEPAACLAVSILFALRNALDSARSDSGIEEKWFHLGAPTTPEDAILNSGTSIDMFKIQ